MDNNLQLCADGWVCEGGNFLMIFFSHMMHLQTVVGPALGLAQSFGFSSHVMEILFTAAAVALGVVVSNSDLVTKHFWNKMISSAKSAAFKIVIVEKPNAGDYKG